MYIYIYMVLRYMPEAQAYYRGLTGGVIIPRQVREKSTTYLHLCTPERGRDGIS